MPSPLLAPGLSSGADKLPLNALHLEGWFPLQMSMPLRAKCCAFQPTQTIARLYGKTP